MTPSFLRGQSGFPLIISQMCHTSMLELRAFRDLDQGLAEYVEWFRQRWAHVPSCLASAKLTEWVGG